MVLFFFGWERLESQDICDIGTNRDSWLSVWPKAKYIYKKTIRTLTEVPKRGLTAITIVDLGRRNYEGPKLFYRQRLFSMKASNSV